MNAHEPVPLRGVSFSGGSETERRIGRRRERRREVEYHPVNKLWQLIFALAVIQIGAVSILRNEPLAPSRLGEWMCRENAALGQAAHESGANISSAGSDSMARMAEARWPAQAQMYQTTADAQLKLGQMIAGCITGVPVGGGFSDEAGGASTGANKAIGVGNPVGDSTRADNTTKNSAAPHGAVHPSAHPGATTASTTWVDGGGQFSGAGAPGSWSDEESRSSDFESAAKRAASWCAGGAIAGSPAGLIGMGAGCLGGAAGSILSDWSSDWSDGKLEAPYTPPQVIKHRASKND